MRLFGYIPTRPFLPGVPGVAFASNQLLPLVEIQGAGKIVARQFQLEAKPMVQAFGAPEAWNGFTTGQFVTQGLVDPNGGGPGNP